MNAPAVPDYVVRAAGNFADCPPGHRFSLYFPIWRDKWQLDKNGKTRALREVVTLGSARKTLEGILHRQKTVAESLPAQQRLIVDAISTAPFATGLGLEHPIENGFSFLSPYGLSYLTDSGAKGVLRAAAGELLSKETSMLVSTSRVGSRAAAGELFSKETVVALFGPDTDNKKPEDARRGALSCWDVFPVPPEQGPHKGAMTVEIMTPHYSDYYQNGASPHDAGKPTPIPFLAMPAGSKFRFIITCELSLLSDDELRSDWQNLVRKVVECAFDWLGFGAKTAVGYGAMEKDPDASKSPAIKAAEQWLSASLETVKNENNIRDDKEASASKPMAEKWAAIENPDTKKAVFEVLKSKWDENGRSPSKKARALYDIH